MQRKTLRKWIILGILICIVLAIPIYVIHYYSSTRIIHLDVQNITSLRFDEGTKKGKTYPANTTSVRINKNQTYSVVYTASAGYQSGTQNVETTDTVVTIRPDYSSSKLSELLDAEITAINAAIIDSGTNIETLYTINRGQLSNFGTWYFTTLTYKGSADDDNSDTLVVGLQKKNDTWVASLTPNIIFTTAAYPTVSRGFIEAANNYQKSAISPTAESY